MKKRLITTIVLVMAMLLAGCSGCSGCSACSSAPPLETVYDRIVELIEGSKEINTVLYGAGLPVYSVDSDYARYHQIYGDENDKTDGVAYEMVAEYAKFHSEAEIREAAEKIYTADCLAPFYSSIFDGIAISDSKNGMVVAEARYDVGSDVFGQHVGVENGLSGMRIYDYSTIEIINPSSADLFRIKVSTWMEETPHIIEPVTLSFALGADGQWYLNTFTG